MGYILGNKNKDGIYDYKSYNILTSDYQKRIIKHFFDDLDSQNELSSTLISSMNELIINDKKFPLAFIKEYYRTHNNQYIRMLNEKNIVHFGNILTTILLSDHLDKNDLDNIAVNIIYYGERVYYLMSDSENKKLFLCGFLNKIPLFKCIQFWESAIKYKLIFRLQKLTRDIEDKIEIFNKTNKIESSQKDDDFDANNNFYNNGMNIYDELDTTNDTNNTNSNNKKNKFFLFANKLKLLNLNNNSNNKNGEFNSNHLLVSIINYNANFEELTYELKKEYLKKAFEIFNSIITEFIPGFINYNFGLNNSLELLVKICNDFSI